MRRLASVFAKRSDKSDAGASADGHQPAPPRPPKKSNSRLLNATAHITVSTERPSLAQANSSASSSSGCASLQTPEDDAGPYAPQEQPKKALMSWLGRKKTGPSHKPDEPRARQWEAPARPVPALYQPPLPIPGDRQQPAEDSEDDTSSEERDGGQSAAVDRPDLQLTPSSLSLSQTRLMSVISSSLAPSFSPPPCLHPPSGPLFPRSCNSARGLPFQDTARTCMLKTLLLRRLQSNNLSRSEALSIAPFASKSSEAMKVKSSATSLSEAAVASKRVERFSEGLRRWACRPCFEDRMIVWEPADNAPVIVSKRVSGNGRGYGVASLEFSEGLEALAGLLVDEEPPELSLSPMAMSHSIEDARVPFSTASSDSSHGHPQLNGKSTLPSPLRIEETPSLSAAIHLSLPASSSMPSSPSTAPTSPDSPMPAYPKLSLEPPTVKAKRDSPKPHDASADDLADRIPLGYALRVKKQREQKARFLEEERQRRMSAEKKKLEEERRKHEEEKLQWERERKAWEREKKAMEEEKKQRKLKEEVVAARMRREEERTGARRVSASVVEGEKNEQSRSKRDSSRHRQDKLASDPHLPLPGVARPPSVADSHHRPVSMHSTRGASTEDVRLKDRGRKSSRRQSAASDADSPSTGAPPSTWSMYGMPAVPPMPMMTMSPYGVPSPYMDNMPLLPPNAPFMTQGYGDHRSRSRSGSKDRRDSSQSSRSSSHSRPHSTRSNNNSTERVHQIHGHGSPGATRVASDSHRSHERRPSGGESPNRTSAHRGQLANQGRSYSGSDVERRYSSLRGHASSSSPSTPVRPTMVSSASWGGPWVVQPTMPPSMPMYSGAPAFTAAPIPMMAQGMAQTRSPASHHRQSVIF